MTKIKKTLGRNWTRYHNYYGMTHILERACSKKLHWNWETIREYTVSHAPEVNYEKAKQHVDNSPPLPENDDDDWYRRHPKLPGSGKAPHKQLQPKVQKGRARQKVVRRSCHQPCSRRRSLTGINQAQWPCERLGGTKSPLNCSSGSCHSRDW